MREGNAKSTQKMLWLHISIKKWGAFSAFMYFLAFLRYLGRHVRPVNFSLCQRFTQYLRRVRQLAAGACMRRLRGQICHCGTALPLLRAPSTTRCRQHCLRPMPVSSTALGANPRSTALCLPLERFNCPLEISL